MEKSLTQEEIEKILEKMIRDQDLQKNRLKETDQTYVDLSAYTYAFILHDGVTAGMRQVLRLLKESKGKYVSS